MKTILARSVCLLAASALLLTGGCQLLGLVILDGSDNGKTITVSLGERLMVVLESNPTTGYSWNLATLDTGVLSSDGHSYKPNRVPAGVTGSGGIDRWFFTTESAGATTLRLEYRGPSDDVAEVFEVTVIVEP
jgi:inhibitor of cysteine peptidase